MFKMNDISSGIRLNFYCAYIFWRINIKSFLNIKQLQIIINYENKRKQRYILRKNYYEENIVAKATSYVKPYEWLNLIGKQIRIWYGKLQHERQRWMLKKMRLLRFKCGRDDRGDSKGDSVEYRVSI